MSLVFLSCLGSLIWTTFALVAVSEPPAASGDPREALVSAYAYLPAPKLTIPTEIGFSLSDRPIETTESSVTYRTNDTGTITYMLHDKDTRDKGWFDLELREAIITLICHEAGISPYTMHVSMPLALPSRRDNMRKLAFAISKVEYNRLVSVNAVEMRYVYKSGIDSDLELLSKYDTFPESSNDSLVIISAIMNSLITKIRGLGELGFVHGAISLGSIYARFDNNAGAEIFLSDFFKADFISDKKLLLDWVNVLRLYGTLLRQAGILLEEIPGALGTVGAAIRSMRALSTSGGTVADYSKIVSDCVEFIRVNFLDEPMDDGRPTKTPPTRAK